MWSLRRCFTILLFIKYILISRNHFLISRIPFPDHADISRNSKYFLISRNGFLDITHFLISRIQFLDIKQGFDYLISRIIFLVMKKKNNFIYRFLTLHWHHMHLGVGQGQNEGLRAFCHILTLFPPGAFMFHKHMSCWFREIEFLISRNVKFLISRNNMNIGKAYRSAQQCDKRTTWTSMNTGTFSRTTICLWNTNAPVQTKSKLPGYFQNQSRSRQKL